MGSMGYFGTGIRLRGIKLVDNGSGVSSYVLGDAGVTSITVVEVTGQGAMVPWAEVRSRSGERVLVNLAHVESVYLLEPTK